MRMQQCQMIVLLFLNSMQVPWANSAILCPNAFLHESAVREKREKVNETPEKCVRVSILICVGSKSKGDHAQFLPPSEAAVAS
jgi:hypothetical protein